VSEDPAEGPVGGAAWFRRPWFVVILLAAVVLAVLVVLLVGGDDGAEVDGAAGRGTTDHLTAAV
jgi:hypothetical protein